MDALRGQLDRLKTRPAGKSRDEIACDIVDALGGADTARIPLRVAAVRYVNEHPEHRLDASLQTYLATVQRDGGLARHKGHETSHEHTMYEV